MFRQLLPQHPVGIGGLATPWREESISYTERRDLATRILFDKRLTPWRPLFEPHIADARPKNRRCWRAGIGDAKNRWVASAVFSLHHSSRLIRGIPFPPLLSALLRLLRQIPKTFDGDPLLSYRIAENLMTASHSGADQVGHIEKLIFWHKV